MINKISFNDCTGCSACVNICPKNSITMQENLEGFLYPSVDANTCIKCGQCLNVCQAYEDKKISFVKNKEINQKIFICQNNNNEVRKICTSGGVFYSISSYIFENGGIVFGSVLNEENYCLHSSSDDVELKAFSGSKYVQSDLNYVFRRIKKCLDNGKTVCFSGTPCQVYGLRRFLKKDYDKLILVDLLCHGVPSPGIYKKYIESLEKKYRSKINHFFFRNKDRGYKFSAIRVDFSNGKKYLSGIESDQYLRLFFNDIVLRKSCYNCSFRNTDRPGDITLFDCWHTSI